MTVAVVDVETTGLSPRTDRVVEIGVVLLDDRGEVEAEFETLVNPGRDVGPTGLHGISAGDVVDAPAFADVAQHLRSLLVGRVLVAHNALFDLRFLAREFGRAGLPTALSPSLCTMRLAPLFFGSGTRSLQALCGFLDIPLVHGHAALHDARATAELMLAMLASDLGGGSLAGAGVRVDFADDGSYRGFEALDGGWADLVAAATAYADGSTCPPCRTLPRDAATAAVRERDGYLAGLVASLPALDDAPPSMAPYLTVLDQVLEDRLVSVTEADQLASLAGELGCGPDHVTAAHRIYLEALATAAYADGLVTEGERADLERVAALLGMRSKDVDLALSVVRSGAQVSLPRRAEVFSPGDRIVFTGAMSRTRDELEQAARDAGLRPMSSVSKQTGVLVCADPHSQSGKASKARALGVRVISEAVFWEALSVTGART
ncbi:3'-5' exonuclease [Blastococcus saxobsidens]|uniref:Putative exonuclease, RNase T and DNA polymerase III n=1 Tax=Blastococcus saxobsidens (strain DD2) TaxID=1146883 RepID=H6RT49_BLASD|nr:3'-5' exonuclease [Blastococcus saxobsidens]CCG04352.1 Putative exonuclease, RNase T and DNA polymerase III [Blastococcus saxobsidens DD2]